jgi:Spy/CpxP family protein refolding chaperone
VKIWKVIFAALVIFVAGAVTGALVTELRLQRTPPSAPADSKLSIPRRGPGEFMTRMEQELGLTQEQSQKIDQILRESRDRMRELSEQIAPQARDEHKRTRELIRAELTPEQAAKFEEHFQHRGSERYPRGEGGPPRGKSAGEERRPSAPPVPGPGSQ